jgi:plastocyanin
MALTRLGIAKPAANVATQIANFTNNYLVSVIVTNTAPTATPVLKVTIYVVPSNATLDSQYAYQVSGLTVGQGQTFETFRFGVNPGDAVFVRATTPDAAFSIYGILQDNVVGPGNSQQVFTNKTIRGVENTVLLDKGTTVQRRANAEIGYVRFNTETNLLEVKTTPTDWFSIGRTGPEGPPGAAGDAGPAGAAGPAGPAGPAGTSIVILGVVATTAGLPSEGNSVGDIYIVEADGEAYVWDGDSWESIGTITGPTGPAGEDGATGPAGENGVDGIPGPAGENGVDGTSIVILGVVATTAGLPSEGNSVGDIYIVEADGEAYVWDGDSWESIGTITGPAGADGATGPAGDPGPTGPAGADGADGADGSTTFNGTTDATLAGITINEIAYSAITRLEVTNSGATAYLFNNQYSGNNPTIYAISGTTIAFNLNVTGHPFLIRVSSGGSNYDTGLIHVATDGTVSTGSSAQGKVTGTLYWQVPAAISGNYVYQCSIHSGMVGTITIKDISAI